MKCFRRRGRLAVIAFTGIAVTVFCIEYLSYVYNQSAWQTVHRAAEGDGALRVLFVADPQIQGEQQENFFYGWISRWDADRYLGKNYRLAKQHVSPDVIVFLGDLFDEGSIASDPEYRRYFQRFSSIFDLPTNQNPSTIKHIFVPGDNDVGGEKTEPVNPVKVNWFGKTFGEFRSVTDVDKSGLDAQFVRMNLFMPNEYKNPLKGLDNVINGTKQPDVRFIVSHVSLLSFMTNAVEQVIETFKPFLIFAAHSHKSAYLRYTKGARRGLKTVSIVHNFLHPQNEEIAWSESESGTDASRYEQEQFHAKPTLSLNFKKSYSDIHEIIVPTCSYRMGVYDMGYGAMELYKNGTMNYTVLWLPSRFKQLFLYAAIYIVIKIILTPWIFWKVGTYLCYKFKDSNVLQRANNYMKIV